MPAVVTMVSAHIAPDREAEVVDGFAAAVRAGMPERRHTSLLRGDGDLWRIVTFWRNRGDLDHYLAHAEHPFATTLFERAGGVPRVEILEHVMDNNATWWT
jgi:hypothetical protein